MLRYEMGPSFSGRLS